MIFWYYSDNKRSKERKPTMAYKRRFSDDVKLMEQDAEAAEPAMPAGDRW